MKESTKNLLLSTNLAKVISCKRAIGSFYMNRIIFSVKILDVATEMQCIPDLK